MVLLSTLSSSRRRGLLFGAALYLLWRLWKRFIVRKHNLIHRLQGAVVLITGAGSGIGRGLAIKLARFRKVRKLILWDVHHKNLESTKQFVRVEDPDVQVVCDTVDVSSRDAVMRAAHHCETPDFLVLNAGIHTGNDAVETKSEQAVRAVFAVNVFQLFWCCAAFLPKMYEKSRFNRVVVFSSVAAMTGGAHMVDYAASKWASLGFVESLRFEIWKRRTENGSDGKLPLNTSVSVVCPFLIDTGMFDGAQYSFLLPALKPDYVVDQVVENCVLDDCPQLILPPLLSFTVPCMRFLLPPGGQFWVSNLLGGVGLMDGIQNGKTGTIQKYTGY